jgi:hypothetical protein
MSTLTFTQILSVLVSTVQEEKDINAAGHDSWWMYSQLLQVGRSERLCSKALPGFEKAGP